MPISRIAGLLLLTLAGCGTADNPQLAGFGSRDMQGWRFASGKQPSRAEYAAVVAACEHGAISASRGKALDVCLADLGLRRE